MPEEASAARSNDWPVRRLVERLRQLGMPVQPREAEQIFLVAAARQPWPRERFRQAVLAILPSSGIEPRLFDDAFDTIFPPGQAELAPFGDMRPDDQGQMGARDVAGGRHQDTPPPTTAAPRAAPATKIATPPPPRDSRTRTFLGAGQDIWQGLLADRLGMAILLLGLCGIVALAVFLRGSCCDVVSDDFDDLTRQQVPMLAWGMAALAAAGLLGPTLFALRWLTRSQAVIQPQADPSVTAGPTLFRIGLVGGLPPAALDPERAKSIGDLFAYGPGGEERRELDIARSIEAMLQAGGMPMICHPEARILPLVLMLVDENAPARFWNSLPEEVAEALGHRGLDLRVIGFPGSLHGHAAAGSGPATLRPAVAAVTAAAIAEEAHYTAVLVFSDAANWCEPDTALLRRFKANGPVFWFDSRDRELWDASLDGIRHAGIPIWEATGSGLEEALRSTFAPGRGIGGKARTAGRAMRRSATSAPEGELRALLGAAFDWAGHCSYLEPISFAVADRIRRELHPGLPWIAFSRLTALPGSRVGPEGLRFDAAVRSHLLMHMARHEPTRRRERAVALITDALAEARDVLPPDTSARAIGDLAIARVEVHRDPDAAVRDLLRLRDSGLVEAAPVEAFLRCLRLADAEAPGGQEAGPLITIGAPIREAQTLVSIGATEVPGGPPRPTVSWTLSMPELRKPLQSDTPDAEAHTGKLLAGFIAEDRLILIDASGQSDENSKARLINLPSGLEVPLLALRGRPAQLVAGAGICLTADIEQGVHWLSLQPGAAAPSFLTAVEQSRANLLYIDTGRQAGLVIADGNLLWVGPDQPAKPWPLPIDAPSAVCALGEQLLIGTTQGRLHLRPPSGSAPPPAQPLPGPSLSGPILAIAAAGGDGRRYSLAVAHASGGNIGERFHFVTFFTLSTGMGRTEVPMEIRRTGKTIPLAAEPRELELSADGATLLIRMTAGIAILDTATGLSVLTDDAEDLLASLAADGTRPVQILAADLAARRIAILTAQPPRLEIRRLERIEEEKDDLVPLPPDSDPAETAGSTA
jgi:hypothetical protein